MYKYSAVPLGKGLNFVTGKSILEAGTLVDCLNYEIVDTGGLRRVDGTLKWDGAQDIQSEVLWEMKVLLTTSPLPGDYLYSSRDGGVTTYDPDEFLDKAIKPFGIFVADNNVDTTYFAMLDASKLPIPPGPVYLAEVGASNSDGMAGSPSFVRESQDASSAVLDTWNAFLEGYVPENNSPVELGPCDPARVLGLHYFDKNAYAIVDCIQEVQFTRISSRVVAGDYLTDSAGTAIGLVLYATLVSGSWTGGTDSDVVTLIISPLERVTPTSDKKRYGEGTFNASSVTDLRYFAKTGVRITAVGGVGTVEPSRGTGSRRLSVNSSSIWKSYSETGAAELGGVQSVTVTSGGSGYDTAPAVSFSAPPAGGVAPIAYAVMTGTTPNLSVSKVVVVDPGRGYNSSTTNPTVTFTGGAPAAAATATCVRTNWQYSGLHPSHNGWVVKVNSNGNLWPSGYLNKVNKGKIVGNQPAGAVPGNTSFGVPSRILTGLDFDTAVQSSLSNWTPIGATTLANTLVTTADTNGVGAPLRDVWANYDLRTATIGFTGFTELSNSTTGGGPIPEDAIIKGVEVQVTFDTSGTAFSSASITALQARATLFKTSNSAEDPGQRTETRLGNYLDQDLTAIASSWTITSNATDEVVVFGGSTDLWGANLKYTDLWDPNFGVGIDVYVNRASTTGTTFDLVFRIDKVELKVYYYSPSSFLYFGDADGNKIKAYLLDYYVTEGSLESGTAEMYMQVSKLQQVATSTTAGAIKYHIGPTRPDNTTSTMSVYVDEALTASGKVGDVAEDMSYNGLPNYDAIRAADSRSILLDGNFYANEDWAAVYGVTGAGRAFSHDGLFFTSIWAYKPGDTSGDISDKPRHIAIYKDRLVLGYRAGNVSMSAVGEANNFSGVLGAVDIGTGSQVTGLQVFQGNYLAVFCDSKILGITSNFDVTTLSPNSGAIEYTVEAIGNTPVYCNSQGIFTLAQSDKYGDFAGMSLSAAVYPWLRPRLSKSSASISGTSPGGIVQAYVCRSKNQYRLWFADGYQLVMWYTGEQEIAPEFTLMRYSMVSSIGTDVDLGPPVVITYTYEDLTNQVVPLCISSTVDKDGREIMLFYPDYFRYATDQPGAPNYTDETQASNADDLGLYWNHIYRIDAFWQIDGGRISSGTGVSVPIQAFVQFNYWNKENPFIDSTIRKCRLEGASRNVASLCITTDINYNNPDPDVDDRVDVSLDDATSSTLPITYLPKSAMANLAETGRLISIRIDNFDSDNYAAKYTDATSGVSFGPTNIEGREPAHYIQALLLQFEEGKEDG